MWHKRLDKYPPSHNLSELHDSLVEVLQNQTSAQLSQLASCTSGAQECTSDIVRRVKNNIP